MIKYGNAIYERINIMEDEETEKGKNILIERNNKRKMGNKLSKKKLIKERIIKDKKYIFIFVIIFFILMISLFSIFVEKLSKN